MYAYVYLKVLLNILISIYRINSKNRLSCAFEMKTAIIKIVNSQFYYNPINHN